MQIYCRRVVAAEGAEPTEGGEGREWMGFEGALVSLEVE